MNEKPPALLTKIQVEKIAPPDNFLHCPADPDIPDPLNDNNLGQYIVSLWERGTECATNLDEVRKLTSE